MADEVEVFVVEGPDLRPAVKFDSNDAVVARLVAAANVATMKLLLSEINIREEEEVWVLREHNARLFWVKAKLEDPPMKVSGQIHVFHVKPSDEDPRPKKQRMENNVDQIFKTWLMKRKEFFYNNFMLPMSKHFGGLECKYLLPVLRDHDGEKRPSFLVHDLETQVTNVKELLSRIEKKTDKKMVFPILGVSGSGKTRMVYELLSSKYGMFFVGDQNKNGGSRDISNIKLKTYSLDFQKNTTTAKKLTQAAMVARLKIFKYCKDTMGTSFTPRMWLFMQAYFQQFVDYDPFLELFQKISECHDIEDQIVELWDSELIWVIDEAQVLGKGECQFYSAESGHVRTVFSPIFSVILTPATGISSHPVVLSGIGLGFLKLEENIYSKMAWVCMVPTNEHTRDKMFFTNIHTRWTDSGIMEFVNKTVSVDDDVVKYLVEWFVGRRRPLITIIEWILTIRSSKTILEEVTAFVKVLTEKNFPGSFYKMVDALYLGDKQQRFCMRGGGIVDFSELIKIIAVFRLTAYQGRVMGIEKGDALIVEYGLGLITVLDEAELSFTIDEPLVLEAITFYAQEKGLVNKVLKQMMVCTKDVPSIAGRIWEKDACNDLNRWFSTPRKLTECPCFMELPSIWKDGVVSLDDSTKFIIAIEKSTSIHDFISGKIEAKFFSFEDLSGPDVMFFLMMAGRRIPVFCQFKLRKKLSSTEAEKAAKTTEVQKMYANDREKMKALQDICAGGYISLVICFPAIVEEKKKKQSNSKRLIGYFQEDQMKEMMADSYDFVCVLKDVNLKPPSKGLNLA